MRLSVLAFALLFAPALAAQSLTTGTWIGTLDGPGAPQAVTADIERCAEGLKLTLSSDDGRFQVADVILRQDEETVTFRLDDTHEGRPLVCTAERRADGSLDGSCAEGRLFRRARYRLALAPPAQGTIGCTE